MRCLLKKPVIGANGVIPCDNFTLKQWLSQYCTTQLQTGWQIYEPKPEPIPTKKIQNCDPLSLSITDLTQIAGRCLFNLAGKDGEPSSSCLEGIEDKFTEMLSAIAEPKPEPFKVGDWVEVEEANGDKKWTSQRRVKNLYADGSGYGINWDGLPMSLHCLGFVRVIRILPKSEVKVSIMLKGTVRKSVDHDSFCIRYGKGSSQFSLIDYAQLSTDQAAMVRELVES
jgi:hypothetical protein